MLWSVLKLPTLLSLSSLAQFFIPWFFTRRGFLRTQLSRYCRTTCMFFGIFYCFFLMFSVYWWFLRSFSLHWNKSIGFGNVLVMWMYLESLLLKLINLKVTFFFTFTTIHLYRHWLVLPCSCNNFSLILLRQGKLGWIIDNFAWIWEL